MAEKLEKQQEVSDQYVWETWLTANSADDSVRFQNWLSLESRQESFWYSIPSAYLFS